MATALVVSGGGSKGAFAVGAIEVLINELNVNFDIVTGTSTGSLIAPFVAAGEHNQLAGFYLRMRTEHFLEKKQNVALSLFFKDAIFDTGPFHTTLDNLVKPAMVDKVLQNPKTRIALTTVGLQSGKVVYFHTFPQQEMSVPPGTRKVRIRDRDHLLKVMEGSSNQPVFMRPVRIKTSANQPARQAEQFVDGGVREYAPIRVAIENGADKVYAILLGPEKKPPVAKQYRAAFRILVRTFDLIRDDITYNDIQTANLLAEQKGATIKYIRPSEDFLTDSLNVSSIIQARMLELGRKAGRLAGRI